MRTCPRCENLCKPTAIYCIACGAALLPFEDMVRELAAMRRRSAIRLREPAMSTAVAKVWRRCPYCGTRTRRKDACTGCSDLPALDPLNAA